MLEFVESLSYRLITDMNLRKCTLQLDFLIFLVVPYSYLVFILINFFSNYSNFSVSLSSLESDVEDSCLESDSYRGTRSNNPKTERIGGENTRNNRRSDCSSIGVPSNISTHSLNEADLVVSIFDIQVDCYGGVRFSRD